MRLTEAFSKIYSSMLEGRPLPPGSKEHALVYNHTGLQYSVLRNSMAYLVKVPRDKSKYEGYYEVNICDMCPVVKTDLEHERLVIKHLVRENLIEVINLRDFFHGDCEIHFKLTKEMDDILSGRADYSLSDLTVMVQKVLKLGLAKKEFWDGLAKLTISEVDERYYDDDVPEEDFNYEDLSDDEVLDIDLLIEEGIATVVEPEADQSAEKEPNGDDHLPSCSSGFTIQLLQKVVSEDALLSFERTLSKMKDNPLHNGWFSRKVQELSKNERLELAEYVCKFLKNGLTLDSKTVLEHRSLLEKGFLINMAILGDDSGKRATQYLLSPEGCRLLVKGFGMPDYGFITELADVVCYKDIKDKNLFYNFETMEQVDIIRRATSQKDYDRVTKRMVERKRSPALSFLLYGGPGTGKTELAKQVARENKRNLIVADYSKLQSQWIGEAPKRYRQIFIAYKYIAALSDSAPILLFNEADSFLSQRITNITRGYEKEENAIQNLMLQEMENFEGIFIATTNCKQNLDKAFDRRFFSKVEVSTPDEANRRKIWKSIAPEYITEDVANELARDYEFTGANIDNVINRLETISILYDKTPSHDDIIRECEAEKGIEEPRMKPRERVGFSY